MFEDIGCSTRLPDFDLALLCMIEYAHEITETFPFRKISPSNRTMLQSTTGRSRPSHGPHWPVIGDSCAISGRHGLTMRHFFDSPLRLPSLCNSRGTQSSANLGRSTIGIRKSYQRGRSSSMSEQRKEKGGARIRAWEGRRVGRCEAMAKLGSSLV